MNNVVKIDDTVHLCTSCQVCSAVCPTNAIKIKLDVEGFYRPVVDENKCINCGKCKKICYKYDIDVAMSDECKKVFAIHSTEQDVLKTVTSGGAAYVLAKTAIEQGYKVVGVTYNNDLDIAEAEISDCDVDKFKGSKYIQAYTENTFREILNLDNDDDKYMVFGLPCQIYALNKASTATGKRKKFIFVDLYCHGCPSMLVWKKYIDKIKKKLTVEKLDKVEFRSKKRGWHEFCTYFKADGNEYLSKNALDSFYRLFFSDTVLNEACSDCKLRSTLKYTDIRLGDFWGDEYDNNIKGVSAVTAVTELGYEWISQLPKEMFIKEHKLSDVLKAQSYGVQYKVDYELRTRLFEKLRSDCSIDCVVDEYNRNISKKARLKFFMKKIIYMLPANLRALIRKCVHSL